MTYENWPPKDIPQPDKTGEREALLSKLKNWPAERAKNRPVTADDFAMYDQSLSAALTETGVDLPAALAYANRHRLLMHAAGNGTEVLSQYDFATREFPARSRDKLAGPLIPQLLKDAIDRMTHEIEHRKTLGFKTVSRGPGCDAKIRTSTHDSDRESQAKAERSLEKLNALVLVAGDLNPKIKAIFEAADMLWNPAPPPVTTAAATAPRGLTTAEITKLNSQGAAVIEH